ncbi:extracellular solute-binding protein [Streptomyces sp. NPDC058045]|uniref:extracellular solute-binding protein n=1 Tax=Streptomyces sp. NPDC058045 TaxID=3346311 RepID=UPI0036EF8701
MTVGLTACTGGGSGDTTLTLVAADYGTSASDSSKKYWDKLAARYEKSHPGIRIDVRVYPWSEVDSKVKGLVAAGKAPDMAQIGAYAGYAARHKLYSADDLLSISTQSGFLTPLSQAGQVNRTQYGMPFVSSTRLLFYNKTLFAKAGITAPPQSWTDLQHDARALRKAGVKTPFALPLGPEEAQAETLMWLLSGGEGYTDNVGSYSLDSKTNVNTFDWLKTSLVGEHLTGPVAPGKLDRADAFAGFTRGEVGMLNGHPSLMRLAGKKGVKYGMVPMPGINGRAKATMGVADWMTAFKQNGHGKEIGRFLDYVYSDRNHLAFCEEYGLLPVTASASEKMARDPSRSDLAPFLRELPNAQLYPVGKTSWGEVSAAIKKNIGNAVSDHGNPEAILTQLQRQAAGAEGAS